jgi:hypothetical protein
MSRATPTRTNSYRQFFRVSLRFALVLVAICAAGLTWLHYERQHVAERKAALRTMGEEGFTSQAPIRVLDYVWDKEAKAPTWRRLMFGDDLPGELIMVALDMEEASPEAFAPVRQFPELQTLYLIASRAEPGTIELHGLPNLTWVILAIDDLAPEALHCFAQAPQLTEVKIEAKRPVGTGLEHLRRLPELTRLDIDAPVTDDDLRHIARLTTLRHLRITSSQITDVGLAQLAPLSNLEVLVLDGAAITGKGLESLKQFSELTTLELPRCNKFTDAGLGHAAHFPRLETLELCGHSITDEGVEHLAGLPKLRRLTLHDTGVSGVGIIELADQMPLLRFEVWQGISRYNNDAED